MRNLTTQVIRLGRIKTTRAKAEACHDNGDDDGDQCDDDGRLQKSDLRLPTEYDPLEQLKPSWPVLTRLARCKMFASATDLPVVKQLFNAVCAMSPGSRRSGCLHECGSFSGYLSQAQPRTYRTKPHV